MTLESLGAKLATVPERALSAVPSLSSYGIRPARRNWAHSESIAAFGLGLAVGVALGFLLLGSVPEDEAGEPVADESDG